MVDTVTFKELKDVVRNAQGLSLKEAYFLISSPEHDENITVITPARIGDEFNKTMGYTNVYPGVIIYRCLYGKGIMMIQKSDESGDAKEVRIASLRPGVEVEVPFGYAHAAINTGKIFLVVTDNAPKDNRYKKVEYIRERKGLVYYIVDKKGEIAFEKNPNYKFHPQLGI